jgi:peroxiredoxin
VARAGRANAQFRDGTKVGVKGLRAFDKAGDLAILEVEDIPATAKPLPLGPRTPPSQGDAVTAIGHPAGLNFSASNGIVSAVRKNLDEAQVKSEDDRSWVQTTAALAGGNSGGPLLSGTGQVVGINTIVVPGSGVGFAVHVSHLIDLLDRARASTSQPLPADPKSDLFNPLAEFEPRVGQMLEEYRNAYAEFERMRENANPFQLLFIAKDDPGPKYAQRFLQTAERGRRTIEAFQGLYLACLLDKASGPAASLKRALDLLLEDHIREKWLDRAIPGLIVQTHEAVPDFLRKVLEQSPHENVRGVACFYLAVSLRRRPGHGQEEVLRLLKRCADEFKDVRTEIEREDDSREIVLGEVAKPMIFEAENLSVGRKAPEIVGQDASGKTFKLSEYRGKVVVLDFFADWCPYCVRMYPEERELVEKLADKPFAMLGVNCDGQETLRQLIADKKVTWRCWSDGQGGPIAKTWQLSGYPLTYVIDQDGVIRHKYMGMINPGILTETVTRMVDGLSEGKPADTGE